MVKLKNFVKKPIKVKAAQWFAMGDHPDVLDATKAIQGDKETLAAIEGRGWLPSASNDPIAGGQLVSPGDWIITGIKGEVYLMSNEAFEAHYDPA